MKYLLSIISILGMTSGTLMSAKNYQQNSLLQNKTNQNFTDKIDIDSLTFITLEHDIKGEKSISKIERAALIKLGADSKNPETLKFLEHYLEYKEQYLTIGEISVLPKVGEVITFEYDVYALSNNDSYEGITSFTIKLSNSGISLDKPLEINEEVNFSEARNLETSWWVWDSYTKEESWKIIKWSDYEKNWGVFLDKYANGQNAQMITFDVNAYAETDFYASNSIDTSIEVFFGNITTSATSFENEGQSIDMFATVGTSKVEAKFVTSMYRDSDYIYLDAKFYLGLGSYAYRYVTMDAEVNNLKIVPLA